MATHLDSFPPFLLVPCVLLQGFYFIFLQVLRRLFHVVGLWSLPQAFSCKFFRGLWKTSFARGLLYNPQPLFVVFWTAVSVSVFKFPVGWPDLFLSSLIQRHDGGCPFPPFVLFPFIKSRTRGPRSRVGSFSPFFNYLFFGTLFIQELSPFSR